MVTIDNLSIQVTASADSAASALDRLASSAGGLRGAAQKASNGLKDIANSAKEAGTETSNAGTQAEKLGSIFQVLGNTSKNGASNIATFWQAITGAVGAISRVTGVSGFAQDALGMLGKSFAGIGQAISKYGLMGLPKFFGDELVSSIKKPISAIGNFVAGIKRIAYYRIIRTIIKEITQAINEGMKSLYAWSKTADGTFKKTMDGLATSSKYLGNSFASMISPLINALSPAIDFIVGKFVDMFNTISQIIARLTGQTSYTAAKKVAAQWGDASKSAGKSAQDAADKIKRTILGFDEINKLNGKTDTDSGSGGGGSGGGAAGMFETLPIEGEIVSFADMLKNAFIHGEWHTLGTLLGDKINEMVDSIDWAGTGETVGWYINGWFSTKYWTLDTINFTNIGSKIAEFLNSMIEQIDFNILGRLMVQKFTIVFDMVIGFIETFDWGQAGEKLSNFATGVFQELSKWLQETDWKKLGESIINGIVDFFGSADYSGLAKSASEFLGSALGAAVGLITGLGKAIGEKIGEAFNGIGEFFNEQIEACGGDIVGGILRGIIVGLTNIGVWIVENIFQPFINGFKAAFGIASPATTMEEPGENIVLGIFQGIINALKNVGQWVKDNIFTPIWNAIKEAGTTAIEITVSLVQKVGDWASDIWEFITNGKDTVFKTISLIGGSIAEFAGGIWDFVLSTKDTVFKTISLIGGSIADFAGGIWDFVLDTKETVFKKISLMAGSIAEFAGGIWDFVLDTKETVFKKISLMAGSIAEFAGGIWDFVLDAKDTIFKKISLMAGSIAEFAGGIWDFVLDAKDTIFKKISLIGGSIADFAGGIWDFVLDAKETVAKTIQLGMDKAASWVDSIVDFILGPESSDKKANIAMAIENTALAIVNFLRDPVTAIKNVMLELGVKFAQGVEKFWNWITGQDGQSEVTVDAYGNFMIVPKAGEGLTDKGNGQFALTNDVAGTTVLTPEKSDNWEAEWDKLVGGEIDVKVKANVIKGTVEDSIKTWFDNAGGTITTTISTLLTKGGTWINEAWTALTAGDKNVTTTQSVNRGAWDDNAFSALQVGAANVVRAISQAVNKGSWDDSAYAATGIPAVDNLGRKVTQDVVKGDWNNNAYAATAIEAVKNLGRKVTQDVVQGDKWNGDAYKATSLEKNSGLTRTVNQVVKRGSGWNKNAYSATKLKANNGLKRTVNQGVFRASGWSDSAYNAAQMRDSTVTKVVQVSVKADPKNNQVIVKPSTQGDGSVKVAVAALGGVLKNGVWRRIAQFANGGIFSNGFWKSIPQYAGGTTNAHGSMFLAGEAGPELVGHVGGRTEVLNQSQLAATMFSAVRAAMGGVKIAATMYDGGADNDEADYEMMYRAMYDAFTDAMAGSNERDREKVALMRQIAAKEFTAEVTANSVNRAQTRMNRRAGTTIVPVGT